MRFISCIPTFLYNSVSKYVIGRVYDEKQKCLLTNSFNVIYFDSQSNDGIKNNCVNKLRETRYVWKNLRYRVLYTEYGVGQ